MIELVIGLGLLIIIVTVLAIAMVNGLKNSQFSKNQVQATKLAQEGLEKTRTVRERNYSVCGPGTIKSWSDMYTTSLSCAPDCPSYILRTPINPVPPSCAPSTATEYWLNNVVSTQTEDIVVDGVTFSRLVLINNYTGQIQQKEVTVTVSWTDISGSHSSKLVTVFTQ